MVVVPLVITPVVNKGAVAVHAKVAPVVVLLKVTKAVLSPEQIICGAGEKVTAGLGLTVTIIVNGVPEQLPNLGVTL